MSTQSGLAPTATIGIVFPPGEHVHTCAPMYTDRISAAYVAEKASQIHSKTQDKKTRLVVRSLGNASDAPRRVARIRPVHRQPLGHRHRIVCWRAGVRFLDISPLRGDVLACKLSPGRKKQRCVMSVVVLCLLAGVGAGWGSGDKVAARYFKLRCMYLPHLAS